MKQRVMVTGGAGFVGSAVLRELRKLDCELFVLDDLSFGRRENVELADERFMELDILDQRALAESARAISPSWVIHLAAVHFIPYCNANPYRSANINLQGTVNLLDSLREVSSLRKVFFASSAAVYADSPTAMSEGSPVIPLDIYGLTKSIGERLVSEFHRASGVSCVIGRLFNAYGPRETNAHLIPEILRQVLDGSESISLGNTRTRRDYIHTSDVARAIVKLLLLEREGFDTFNIGSGHSYDAREIVHFFERAANRPLAVNIATDRVRKVDRAVLQADITKINQITGWTPEVEIQEGIRALVQEDALLASSAPTHR